MTKYLIVLVGLVTGCSSPAYNYGSIGFGELDAHNWHCSQSTTGYIQLGRVYELEEDHHIDINLAHTSQPNCGSPFNKRKETSSEFMGIHYRYIFNRSD